MGAERVRFPLENAPVVRSRVRAFLNDRGASMLVSSAACGADFISLNAAGELGLGRRIVLPFDAPRFREVSVTDRPGD
jgi:hypothetical protein